MPNLIERCAAADATRIAFGGRPFAWGKVDCLTMVHFHLSFLGHAVPPVPVYRSYSGAVKAIRAQGFADLRELLSAYLEPIAPAAMLVSDLALLKGPPPFGGLAICVGAKVMCFAEDEETLVNFTPFEYEGAWRV